jgi:hypothetical protein
MPLCHLNEKEIYPNVFGKASPLMAVLRVRRRECTHAEIAAPAGSRLFMAAVIPKSLESLRQISGAALTKPNTAPASPARKISFSPPFNL